MNGKDLKGRPLRVNEADNRPPRPGGPGGGGGYRPAFGAGAGVRAGAPRFEPGSGGGGGFDFPMDERGRPFKAKGSRRNIRRRKRGFD